MTLEPITRQEQIIAGKDLQPITRMEKFLKEYGGGGGGSAPSNWLAAEGEPGHVLNRTHYVEKKTVEILPECQPEYNAPTFLLGEVVPIEIGKTYIVKWNGVEYTCVGQDGLDMGGDVCLGDIYSSSGGEFGSAPTGEPFLIGVVSSDGHTIIAPIDGSTELTLSISQVTETIHKLPGKFLPDGVPWVEQGEMVEILPTTEVVGDNGNFNISTKIEGVEVGKSYIVNYNGTEYKCVGQEVTMIPGVVALGDLGMMDGEPVTGESFIFLVVSDSMFEQMGVGAQIIPFDGAETVSVSLSAVDETLHGIDPRLLPDDLVRDVLVVKVATLDADFKPATASHTGGDLKAACLFGNNAALFAYDGKTLPLISVSDSEATAEFGNIYFSNGSLLRDYVVIDVDGNITTYEMGTTVTV